MADENLDTVRMLFARATELIEDVHEIAVEGQSPRLSRGECAMLGRRLEEAVRDISTLAAATMVLVRDRTDFPVGIDDQESC